MRLDPAGWPFIGGALLVALIAGAAVAWLLAIPFVILGLFFLFFFRDPDRVSPAVEGLVLAPADGRVMVAGPALPGLAPPGDWAQVSIFLSPLDVHINRMPVAGVVTRIDYRTGAFLAAYKTHSGHANERNEVWIDTGRHTVVTRQVVGMLARRIVCRVEAGATVAAGDRFGLMKFGSRMDVFVPAASRLLVSVGEHVRGGETPVAALPDDTSPR
jgi:phosphatidylserine decarboxylase